MSDEILFGAIAVQEGLLTPAQLEEALARQMASKPPRKIGELLVERGALTAAQVDIILDIQRINIADRMEAPDAGGLFGQIAVQSGFVTADQVNECVRAQQESAAGGAPTMIGQLLLQRGYLKYDQFIEVLARQEKFALRCVGCGTHYLIEGLGQGTKFLCRKCLRVLTVPAFSASAAQRATVLAREERERPPERVSGRSGESLGGYVVDTELGRSSHHVVFKARHRDRDRLVALRLIRPDGGPAPRGLLDRLKLNAGLVRGVEHAGIASLVDAGEIEGSAFLAFDFVGGETLGRILMKRARPLPAVVGILEQAARALHHAHRQGLVHGDLKPSAILVDPSGAPHITDFGLAGLLEEALPGGTTVMPYYRSPEIVRREAADGRADVWALGAILYEAISGRLPFSGSTPSDVADAVTGRAPVAPTTHKPEAPRDLETVCLQALEKRPANRHATAADFADDLARWLAGRPVSAVRASAPKRWLRNLWGAFKGG